MRIVWMILTILGGLGCIAAGVYMLVSRSWAAERNNQFDGTMLDVVIHGVGAYAVARGLALVGNAFRREKAQALPAPANVSATAAGSTM